VLQRTLSIGFIWMFAAALRAQSGLSIGVLLKFDNEPGHAFLQSLERELGEVMADSSIRLNWVFEQRHGESWSRVFNVTLHGACSGALAPRIKPGIHITLAHSISQDGSILPYAELDCDRLKSFLQTEREARFGRAAGRVLAHELYHVLLQTPAHSETGIAKAVQTPAALLSRSLRFRSEDLERLRCLR